MRRSMSLSLYGLLWSLLLHSLVHSQILSNVVQLEAPGNFSASCSATFNQSVACSLALSRVASRSLVPTSNDLPKICTDACLSELKSLRTKQLKVCNDSDVAVIDGLAYPATYTTDLLLFTYNYLCMKSSTASDYCFPDFWEWNNDTTAATSAQLCSDCNLRIQQAQLESPFGYDDGAASDYASLASSCKVTKFPVTSPSTYTLPRTTKHASTRVTATAAAAPSCKSTYTIKKNDTCKSVIESQKVSTFHLMQANNLPGYCSQFPPAGTDLCIPESCNLYTVASNDTCYGIAQAHNGTFTAAQLISWNPNINRQCSNLNQIAGYQICVSFPGPPSVVATGSESITTVVATGSESITTVASTRSESITTVVATRSESITTVVATRSESITTVVATRSESITTVVATRSESITTVASTRSESITTVVATGSESITTVASTRSESIKTPLTAIPTNLAKDTTTDCDKYYLAVDGDNCTSISTAMGISFADFRLLNLMIDSTCSNLLIDKYYCVEAAGKMASYLDYKHAIPSIRSDPCHKLDPPASCLVTTYTAYEPTKTFQPGTWRAPRPPLRLGKQQH